MKTGFLIRFFVVSIKFSHVAGSSSNLRGCTTAAAEGSQGVLRVGIGNMLEAMVLSIA